MKTIDLTDTSAEAMLQAQALIAKAQTISPTDFAMADGSFFMAQYGGIYEERANSKGEMITTWLSSFFRISHATRSFDGGGWGRVLEWTDADKKEHSLSVSMSELTSSPATVWASLAEGGLSIASGRTAREKLITYIQNLPVAQSARTVLCTGWTDKGQYVLPSGDVLGGAADGIVLFKGARIVKGMVVFDDSAEQESQQVKKDIVIYQGAKQAIKTTGTIKDWRDSVAALARGNSRLMLAIMASFAAPLLTLCGEAGGGFHFRGSSSTGKTTALKVAASVGGADVKTWRATSNGLEGVASAHNDSLLLLDEINQCSPFEVGDTAYMLANGIGKMRASRSGASRASAEWTTLFLSSGEQDLESILTSVKKKTMAGMEIRMLSIPADAGAEMGMLEDLHGYKSAGAMAEEITAAAERFKGAAQKDWLDFLTDELVQDRARESLKLSIDHFVNVLVSPSDSGQVRRAARRFAVLGAAGLATKDLTGWRSNEVRDAVKKCFDSWKLAFGADEEGSKEDMSVVEQVRAFIQANGNTRFQALSADLDAASFAVRDRVGFRRYNDDTKEIEYIVFPTAFKTEIAKGFDANDAAKILFKAGMLKKIDDKSTVKVSLPGLGRPRVYVLVIGGEKEVEESITNENF